MYTEHWVEYVHAGSLFNENSERKLDGRYSLSAIAEMPRSAFGFRLFDVEVRSGTLEDGEKIEDRKITNRSGVYYPGGTVLTLDQIKALDGDYEILIRNMIANDHKSVVRTKLGNFQPFNEGDIVI